MALHLSWTSVIVGCISASLAGIFNNSDLYPRLWKESSGASSISDAYPPLWKESPGRLADPTQRTGCGHESGDHLCISVDSWWADFNYYLSAMPFLAAIDSGIMGISSDNVTFLPPSKDQMSFCYNVSSCHSSFPEAMKKWNEFYQHVKSCSDNLDDLLKYLWAAHVSSLKIAHKNFHDRLKYYSKQEADFERSWALFVDYLAPPRFPTTLTRMYEFQKGLPTRMLASGDIAPFIKDFTGFQNTVLLALNFIRKVHEYTGTLSFTVWKTLMKVKVARKLFLEILEFILHFFN
ncbi:protein LEG1 homolog isoform X3 [Equus asinus]|uniref:protein LEG1 homolog isoform X3 n=1 Tax=Equus asinus TaxID=9793 RepID=UPI0038F76A2F